MTQTPPPEALTVLPPGPWCDCALKKDPDFLAWLLLALGIPKVRDQLKDLDWSTVETPLDVECFLAGSAWTTFWRDKQAREDYEKVLLPPNPNKISWWSELIWSYTNRVWFFPSGIIQERHQEAFIRGVQWRKKNTGLPTRSLQDLLQLVIGLSEKRPSKAFARAFTKLFPDDRVEDRVLVLSGHKSYMEKSRRNLVDVPPRGMLGSPWIIPDDRKSVTSKMQVGVLYGPMVGVLSSPIVERKIRLLPKSKGNTPWVKRVQLGLSTIDNDKDLLPILPTITQPDWLRVIRDMVARRDLFDQGTRMKSDSLRKSACVAL
jgi:hypothetical protein